MRERVIKYGVVYYMYLPCQINGHNINNPYHPSRWHVFKRYWFRLYKKYYSYISFGDKKVCGNALWRLLQTLFYGVRAKTVWTFLCSRSYICNVSRRHSIANLMNGFILYSNIFNTDSDSGLSEILQTSTKLYVRESNENRDVILKCDKTVNKLFLYFVADILFLYI